MREISIIIILIYRKLGSVGPVQQKIKLPSPYSVYVLKKAEMFKKIVKLRLCPDPRLEIYLHCY